jgi:hypothetical protein
LRVLGLSEVEFFPAEVREAFSGLQPPPDIDWVGSPVWRTAYVTALRAIATSRRRDRQAANGSHAATFNAVWESEHLRLSTPEGEPNPAYLGAAALEQLVAPFRSQLGRAVSKVRLANTLVASPPETLPSASWSWASTDDERTGMQAYVGDSLRWFSVSPPRMSEETKLGRKPQLPDALLVVLPTASGKTKIAGDWLAAQGVGKAEQRPRVLWVTDQQRLVTDCMKPDKTLRRCLPEGTNVTAVWEGHKEPEDAGGDVVVITKNSLEVELETGLINPDDYDIVVFDEADIMMSELKMGIMRRFDACKKLLLTATPSRSARKDLQRMVHHVRPLTLLEAVERKVIAPVQILTFVARDQAHAEELATAIGLHLFIKEGKKATMYCQPGGQNAQARRIAEAVQGHAREVLGDAYQEDAQYAEMVGSVRPDSTDVIDHFETEVTAGLLTTSSMLGRGWDPYRLDGAIFIGEQGDPVAFLQEMGRAFRLEPANPNKIATIVQIKFLPQIGHNDYSAEMAFGLEEVVTGITLGPETAPTRTGGAPRRTPDPELQRLLSRLPNTLRDALQPLGRPLAEILIAPNDPRYNRYTRPAGFDTSVSDLMEMFPGISRQWFHYHLDRFRHTEPDTEEVAIGIPHTLVRAMSPAAPIPAERFYDSEGVQRFLEKVDVPKIAGAESLGPDSLAQRLGVPVTLVLLGARTLGIVKTEKAMTPGKGAKPGTRYNGAEIAQISKWVEDIPIADDTKVWYTELTRQYGKFVSTYFTRTGVSTQTLRHPPDAELNGIGPYVDIDDADAMKAEYARNCGANADPPLITGDRQAHGRIQGDGVAPCDRIGAAISRGPTTSV